MCLITRQRKAKIAKNDIIVYKILISSKWGFLSMHDFLYKLGVLYETEIKLSNNVTYADWRVLDHYNFTIFGDEVILGRLKAYGQGFHSFCTRERCWSTCYHECIVECTIPKGSEYYLDATGLCVSNKIIINKALWK